MHLDDGQPFDEPPGEGDGAGGAPEVAGLDHPDRQRGLFGELPGKVLGQRVALDFERGEVFVAEHERCEAVDDELGQVQALRRLPLPHRDFIVRIDRVLGGEGDEGAVKQP